MESSPFRFCPLCGQALTNYKDGERLRRRCEHCGWIHYHNPTVGVAVIFDYIFSILEKRTLQGHKVAYQDIQIAYRGKCVCLQLF